MALRLVWFMIGLLAAIALIGVVVGHYELVAGGIAFTVVLVALDVAFSGARKRQAEFFGAMSGALASAKRETTEKA